MATNNPFGLTRTHVAFDHALIADDGHVVTDLTGWENAQGVVLISPAMGPSPRGPRFCQYLVHGSSGARSRSAGKGTERLVFVLNGRVEVDGQLIEQDGFVYQPAGATESIAFNAESQLLVFEKPYVAGKGVEIPPTLCGLLADAPCEPFLGDEDAMLATLLPTDEAFDMAVNVFTYQPGATLPFVETHVMEHGLYMAAGQGVYRLGDSWYPVQQGDSIWMAAYCPQWFVAMGKSPARYIYYKDMNRSPLAP